MSITEKIKSIIPYIIEQNWLLSYASLTGIEKILYQMDYRTKHCVHMQEAMVELEAFYLEFEEEFFLFFDELIKSCKEKIIALG